MTKIEITEERYQQLDLALLRLQAVVDLVTETKERLPAERIQADAERQRSARNYHQGLVDGVDVLLDRLVVALATKADAAPVAATTGNRRRSKPSCNGGNRPRRLWSLPSLSCGHRSQTR
jgi:hypothetical protein